MTFRTLVKKLCTSEQFNRLSWFDEVLYYRLIAFSDNNGCIGGTASEIRSLVFPLTDSLTATATEAAIGRLVNVGLIVLQENENGRPTLRLEPPNSRERRPNRTLDCVSASASPTDSKMSESQHNGQKKLPKEEKKTDFSLGCGFCAQKSEKPRETDENADDDAGQSKTTAGNGTNKVIQENENKSQEENINHENKSQRQYINHKNKSQERDINHDENGNITQEKNINIISSFSHSVCGYKDRVKYGGEATKPPAAVTHREKSEHKRYYGRYDNVLLTEGEYAKICAMSGGKKAIEFLSEYIEMKDYRTNSHYLCIAGECGWVFKAMKERGIPINDDEEKKPSFDLDSFFDLAVKRGKAEARKNGTKT